MREQQQEDESPLVVVAHAVRTRGLKGEIVADLLTDFPERFESDTRLIAVGSGGHRQSVELEKHWFQQGRIILKFAGYDNPESASALVGCEFAVPEAERFQLPEDSFYNWEVEGCLVETVAGVALGSVREIIRTGGAEVLVVKGNGPREYLIPMAESIVVELDVARKRIRIDPPEGLLDL